MPHPIDNDKNLVKAMYKILIADDHPLFREAIHNVISDGFAAAR